MSGWCPVFSLCLKTYSLSLTAYYWLLSLWGFRARIFRKIVCGWFAFCANGGGSWVVRWIDAVSRLLSSSILILFLDANFAIRSAFLCLKLTVLFSCHGVHRSIQYCLQAFIISEDVRFWCKTICESADLSCYFFGMRFWHIVVYFSKWNDNKFQRNFHIDCIVL